MNNHWLKVGGLGLAALILASCSNATSEGGSKPAVTPTLDAAPAAVVANDNLALGVYKGVITDTDITGSFWVEISDPDAGKKVLATSAKKAALHVLMADTAGTVKQDLTGTISGNDGTGPYTVTFTWTANGTPFTMAYVVSETGVVSTPTLAKGAGAGTPIGVTLQKETTTRSVQSWEGSVSGSSSFSGGIGVTVVNTTTGKWNFIRTVQGASDTISGSWSTSTSTKVNGSPYGSPAVNSGSISGTVASNAITFGPGVPDQSCTGTFAGSSVGGSWAWKDNTKGAGTWSGRKKQ